MTTFVFIHGAWQGNYSWLPVKEKLEKSGYQAIALELPGHGNDHNSAIALHMDTYRNAVLSCIAEFEGKVVLVGHSMAGMIISATAEFIPDKIAALVYLSAYIPLNGQTLTDLRIQNKNSKIIGNAYLSADKSTIDIDKDKIIDIFYHDAPDYHQIALKHHHAEPVSPFRDSILLSDNNFGRIPKYYIHTMQDRAIPFAFQQQMAKDAGIKYTYTLDCGHMPQLSMSNELMHVLLEISTITEYQTIHNSN